VTGSDQFGLQVRGDSFPIPTFITFTFWEKRMRISFMLTVLAICGFIATTGCEVKKIPTNTTTASGHDEHDHSHGHGPNGGHLAHFEPSEAHFEWTHDDAAHKLEIHLEELVSGGAKIESVEIVVTTGDNTKKFPLTADEKAKIAGSVYSIVDKEVLTLIGASGKDAKGVQAKVVAKIDGKTQTCLLVEDEHAHHH
jgi:hypothetical protein